LGRESGREFGKVSGCDRRTEFHGDLDVELQGDRQNLWRWDLAGLLGAGLHRGLRGDSLRELRGELESET
jgi:hypothetical protein